MLCIRGGLPESSHLLKLSPCAYSLQPFFLLLTHDLQNYTYEVLSGGLLFVPSPADLPDPGIEPGSPALQADFLYQLIYQGSPDLCLPWPVVSFLFPHLTCSRTLPNNKMCNILLRWSPLLQRPVGASPHFLQGGAPSLLTPK